MADEIGAVGGIALLCENLMNQSQPDASRLQAAQTLAKLSATPVNAVAIADRQRPNMARPTLIWACA
eukprot:2288405-Prymnesium_polylepis.1